MNQESGINGEGRVFGAREIFFENLTSGGGVGVFFLTRNALKTLESSLGNMYNGRGLTGNLIINNYIYLIIDILKN